MKKRNPKYLIVILLLICYLIPAKGISQTATSVKDTLYIFICKGTLGNGQPIVSYAAIKDLNSLGELPAITSQDSFMCAFFKQSVLFEEPVFTLSKNQQLYEFKSEKEKTRFLGKLSKKIDKLNTAYSSVNTRVFANGRSIELQCARLVGEFWSIPKKPDELNNYNHSFLVQENCYDKNYIYNLKDIDQPCKLTQGELELIRKSVK